MAGTDFSHLTNDEIIKGIKALKLPDYIRSKAHGVDVRETLAQMTEMTIQLGTNMGLSPDEAMEWARKLQESVSQSEFDSWVATLLDGGPSIFMNTLIELQTTYPNGAAGVALVRETDPAKIYVWNGSAWEDFGDYQGIEVKDRSITPSKTSFIEKSKNIFNADDQTESTIKDNHFISSGVLFPDRPGYFVTAPIPVKSTTTYSVNEKIWAALGTAVAINTFSPEGVYRNGHNTQTFTTPTNCAYIQISVDKTLYPFEWVKNNFMLVEGSSIPTTYQAPGFFLSESIKSQRFLSEDSLPEKSKPLYVSISNETLKVNAKYNATQDARYTLGKRGVNNIFDFIDIVLVNNTKDDVSIDSITNDGTLWSAGTDTFGPHVISAVNNADGDNQVLTHFTGGNHGYDGGGNTGQSATGRTAEIIFKVEGRTVTNYTGHANYIEVIWTNYIQGNNTKKVDGSGREILKETVRLFFDGIKWLVDYQSEALEDLTYGTFYGLQLVTAAYTGGVYYHTSENKKWNPNNGVSSDSQDLQCSMISVRDSTFKNYVDISLDKTHGLGTRDGLKTATKSALHTTNKAYMYLINNLDMQAGDCLSYRGFYKFYSK